LRVEGFERLLLVRLEVFESERVDDLKGEVAMG
jgi:hypothetical protein